MSRIYAIILCLGAFVISADQWTKYLALEALIHEGQSIPFWSWFRFTRVHNHGAAFGILRDLPDAIRTSFFFIMPLTVIGILWWSMVRHFKPEQKLSTIAMGLVLGGAIGNLIDRIRFGYVIDFIDWFYPSRDGTCIPLFYYQPGSGCHWPVFNIADSAITLAVVLLIWDSFNNSQRHTSSKK
jgi:signal peptidase II